MTNPNRITLHVDKQELCSAEVGTLASVLKKLLQSPNPIYLDAKTLLT